MGAFEATWALVAFVVFGKVGTGAVSECGCLLFGEVSVVATPLALVALGDGVLNEVWGEAAASVADYYSFEVDCVKGVGASKSKDH